jgi:hypothetical protein
MGWRGWAPSTIVAVTYWSISIVGPVTLARHHRNGSGRGIASGPASWATLRPVLGNYELLCDEPRHNADGMFASFRAQ